jgi:predicted dehydrogenase
MYTQVMIAFICMALMVPSRAQVPAPVRLAVAGMSHGHVHAILRRAADGDFLLVGLAESDSALARRLLNQYGLSADLLYADLPAMLHATRPEGVCAFGSIRDHLEAVRACAPLGIHVMVEKPLAVSLEHAREIHELASLHGIHVLTNYETTWYPSVQLARERVRAGGIGNLRKLVIRDGHPGPAEIGVNPEFLAWLTDPVQNGGGAVIDFGCYGANLSTWMMGNRRPLTVTAVLQQFKPQIYPKVDDEATIVLTYPGTQTIVQASWNWPFNRKDMELYGDQGWIFADDAQMVRLKTRADDAQHSITAVALAAPVDDPFRYFTAVIRGTADPAGSLSSLENNMITVEILEAAKQSAAEGRSIHLTD